jgi:uncharacterized membrane protein
MTGLPAPRTAISRIEPMRFVLSGMMFVIGISHFVFAPSFVSIMPPYVPWHLELVYLSGVIELGLGGLVLVERTRNFAAWSLMLLFVAVYPANVHMALHPVVVAGLPGGPVPPLFAWLRLPLQFALIGWAYRYTDRSRSARSAQLSGNASRSGVA